MYLKVAQILYSMYQFSAQIFANMFNISTQHWLLQSPHYLSPEKTNSPEYTCVQLALLSLHAQLAFFFEFRTKKLEESTLNSWVSTECENSGLKHTGGMHLILSTKWHSL